MAPKSESFVKDIFSSFAPNGTEEWLERKRKLDGAEGLWRIHDKLYDLTIWSRIHPGGKFWLEVTRGTDITEVFESHHLSDKAESLLQNFYKREAASPRNSFVTFRQNGFFKTFKRRVQEQNLLRANEPTRKLKLLSDGLAAAVFLTAFLGAKYSCIWILISGVLLGLLSTCSHKFLHVKDNWRINYFNLSLMSFRDWRIRHVLSHHQFRGTALDLEVSMWQPFSRLFYAEKKNIAAECLQGLIRLLQFATAAHFQFLQRFFDVFLSRTLGFQPEEIVEFSLPFFLYFFTGMPLSNVFVYWNLIIAIGSLWFCLVNLTLAYHHSETNWKTSFQRKEEDFGIIQLSLAPRHPTNASSRSLLNSFRKNIFHYLCPTVDHRAFDLLLPAFEKTCTEFEVNYEKTSNVLPGFCNDPPQGNLTFS